jgi:hypothetical protein
MEGREVRAGIGKKDSYKQNLDQYLADFLKMRNDARLSQYLVSNSNLPGPRGNLELAFAFGELVEQHSMKESSASELWALSSKWADISPVEAPVNHPREFLPFCGAYTIGIIGSVSPMFLEKALRRLKELANDPRWRTREAVAMGIQKLIEKHSQRILKELEVWIGGDSWLQMRAVAAGVAEPRLLKDEETAEGALEIHKRIVAQVLSSKERKSPEFKALRQTLGYSISVVVSAVPKEGFEYLNNLALSRDADVVWVAKENLKKNRLVRRFPREVAAVNKSIR